MQQYIDFDTHVYEPLDLWSQYLEPRFRDRAPRWVTDDAGRLLMSLDDKLYPSMAGHPGFARLYGEKPEVDHTGNDPAVRLRYMDQEGQADVHVIFPTLGLAGFPGAVRDADLSAALARAYNRYMGEYCAADRRRLRGAMLIPANHPERAAAEMRWAVENTGMKIAMLAPTPSDEQPWSHPSRDPIWRAAQELEVKIAFHETTSGAMGNAIGIHRYKGAWPMVYLCTHVLEVQLAFADVILGGTLERFPKLKVAATEAHVHWLPGWLALLDQQFGAGTRIWNEQSGEVALKLTPSEYFRRQCFLAAFPRDTMIAEAVEVAPQSIVVCTDYPHPIAKVHGIDQGLSGIEKDPALKSRARSLLVDNALRFMN